MDHKHDEAIVTAVEPLLTRMADLELVLGSGAKPVLARVQQRLIEALAARDRGDLPAVLSLLDDAMEILTALADQLDDPAEAMMMRAVARSFQQALRRGDQAEARTRADFMMARSGAVEKKRQP